MKAEEIILIVDEIQYKNWNILFFPSEQGGGYLQVSFTEKCSVTKKEVLQKGRKWYISPWAVKSEIVLTAFKAIQTAEEHEMREKFKYKGRAILGPHFDVDELVKLCDKKAYEVRA